MRRFMLISVFLLSSNPALASSGENSFVVDLLLNMTLLGSEWVLWLLIGLSIWTVAVILERRRFFKDDALDIHPFLAEVEQLLSKSDANKALDYAKKSAAYEAKICAEALTYADQGKDAIEKAASSLAAIEKSKLEKGQNFLGTLGNNAPFIGLFGTCLGIIQSFNQLALNPAGGPQVVMGGISEALVATAVGLFVAIPAVIAFNYFQAQIEEKQSNADALKDMVIRVISKGGQ